MGTVSEIELLWGKKQNVNSVCFICDRDIMVSGNGSTISFTNLTTSETKYLRCSGDNEGDGVAEIAGHKTLPIFAFTELCYRPKITVLTYPHFEMISKCHGSTALDYLQITFTETEHLIALTSMPDFVIQVWFWRSGTLQFQINSDIFCDHQIMRCSAQLPITIAQLGLTSGQLNVYEVHGSMDLTRLIDRKIKLPFLEVDGPFFCVFGHDGMINMILGNGNIYQVSPTTGACKLIIPWTGEQLGCTPIITNHKSGFVVIGPDSKLKYFKRQTGNWVEVFCIPQEEPITFMRTPFSRDIVIGLQKNGCILKINPDAADPNDIITAINKWNTPVRDFIMLNPTCDVICTLDNFSNLNLFRTENGAMVYSTYIGLIRAIQEHPFLPYAAFGDDKGILTFMEFHDIQNPKTIAKFYICPRPIKLIRFLKTGNHLLCMDDNNTTYLIECPANGKMRIVTAMSNDDTFIDLCVNSNDNEIKALYLVGIPEGDRAALAGEYVIYAVVNLKSDYKVRKKELALLGKYCRLESFADNDLYYAAQYKGFEIHVLKLVELGAHYYIVAVDIIRTIHQLKHVDFHLVYNRFVLTWGFDGYVGVYDTEEQKNIIGFMGSQRRTLGVRKARFDPFRNIITLIGRSGNLHCVKLKNIFHDNFVDSRSTYLPHDFRDFLASLKYHAIGGFVPNNPNDRWTEIQKKLATEKVTELYSEKRKQIKAQLGELREKLEVLLSNNENAPENEKLQIQEFNLNTEASQNMIETARKARQNEQDQMQNFMLEQNRVSDWIKANCWDTMLVKGVSIWGIFSNLSVENYTLLESDMSAENEMKKIRQARASEMLVSYNDIFEPWTPQTSSKLELTVIQRPKIHDQAEEVDDESDKLESSNYSLEGTSGCEYITPLSIHYPQLQVVSFYQLFTERVLGRYENLELRKYFNKKITELQEIKNLEVTAVKQRNERKREIHRELNILLKLKNSPDTIQTTIVDPEFEPDEIPETIVQIQDSEVPVTPYISPSRQKILDEEAEEAERKRLALLADDFRERALEAMMNGVLEIKWEDEIKKCPSKPECVLSGKDPKTYDEADLKSIQQYEDSLAFLRGERDKYQTILEDEEGKLQMNLDSQIMKFNVKVCQARLLKIKVDAAIAQEELKLLRNSWRQFERIVLDREDQSLRQETFTLNQQITKLNGMIRELEQKVLDLRHEYETLTTKDRMLDKQFKSNFVETAPRSIIDQVYKIFKRRPKWQIRAWATTPIILDLAKRVITRNSAHTGPPLPSDCFEFLVMLQQMDNPSVAPSAIDDSLWQLICKMRRIKIESEFKVRACGLQLAEIENACNAFVKELAYRKNEITILNGKIDEVREKRVARSLDRVMQFVVKRGMVEIDLTGNLQDFDNSIFLHYSDVDKINTVIRKVGQKKLRTMQNAAKFRRKIIYKEWEHRYLRNKVRDLQDYIKTIEKCKITKEIQRWLKYKEHGWTEDLSQKALDRGIDSTIKSCERSLEDQRKMADDLQEKLEAKRKENKLLDNQIQELNVEVTERQMARDLLLEEREEKGRRQRMQSLVDRAKLVRLVQEQHALILQLSTTLELQRLRTFPTLSVFSPEEYNNTIRAGCKF